MKSLIYKRRLRVLCLHLLEKRQLRWLSTHLIDEQVTSRFIFGEGKKLMGKCRGRERRKTKLSLRVKDWNIRLCDPSWFLWEYDHLTSCPLNCEWYLDMFSCMTSNMFLCYFEKSIIILKNLSKNAVKMEGMFITEC